MAKKKRKMTYAEENAFHSRRSGNSVKLSELSLLIRHIKSQLGDIDPYKLPPFKTKALEVKLKRYRTQLEKMHEGLSIYI